MCPTLKEEFSWGHFALRFHKTEAFCEAQWQWPRPVIMLYRLVMSAYSIFAFTHVVVTLGVPNSGHNLMVYLTNWTYLLEMLFFFVGAVLGLCFFCWPSYFKNFSLHARKESKEGFDLETQTKVGIDNAGYCGNKIQDMNVKSHKPIVHAQASTETASGEILDSRAQFESMVSLPWHVQIYWLLSNIVQSFGIIVTIVYFGALYSGDGISLLDINVHGINSVMIVIDICINARPVRLVHALYPILYGLLYVFFSVIYWSQDHGRNVLYPNVLDWNKPGQTVAVVIGLAFIGIPLVQLGHYGVYRLRLWVYQKIYGETYL